MVKRISAGVKWIGCWLVGMLAAPLSAAGPELSADEPIFFSAESGTLIARGNAVFTEANSRVEADVIRYQRELELIEAEGNVRLTRAGVRLLADYLNYNVRERSFTARRFRIGSPPVFLEGESFSGTFDTVELSRVSLSLREPTAGSPRIDLGSGRWIRDEQIRAEGVVLRPWGGTGLPLPPLTYGFGGTLFDLEVAAGYRGNLGMYGYGAFLVPVGDQLSLGGELGLYAKRGALVGPRFALQSADRRWLLSMEGAWIRDQARAERGEDVLGEPIGADRGYLRLRAGYRGEGDHVQFQASTTVLSDSELLRDFRQALYGRYYQPDHYLDFNYQKGAFLVNVFARGQLNDHYGMVEKLPEVRLEWLPQEWRDTGVFVQAYAVATHYRQQLLTPALLPFIAPQASRVLPGAWGAGSASSARLSGERFFTRLDGSATAVRPVPLPLGIDLQLRAGGRIASYHRQSDRSLPSLAEQRAIGELGIDLGQTLVRTYVVDNPYWDVEKLRHRTRWSVAWRWHPGAEDKAGTIPAFDQLPYTAQTPVINLADSDTPDVLREGHLLRLAWHHQLLAAGSNGRFRDWLELGLVQDIRPDAGSGESAWEALYGSLDFRPLRWLRLQYLHKMRPDRGSTEATLLRVQVSSSDLWQLALTTEYLEGAYEQYEAEGAYRFAQEWALYARLRMDAKRDRLTRQQYGISRRVGDIWQWEFSVSLNEEDNRESSFGVGIGIRLLPF